MSDALALRLAAGLVLLLALVHSVLGERYIVIRLLRRPNLPKLFGSDVFTKRTLRFAWHLTTLAWCGFAALLLAIAPEVPSLDSTALEVATPMGVASVSRRTVAAIVGATCVMSAVATAVGSRGRHLAWIVFLAIAVLTWWGAR